jgi:hypothetical protein
MVSDTDFSVRINQQRKPKTRRKFNEQLLRHECCKNSLHFARERRIATNVTEIPCSPALCKKTKYPHECLRDTKKRQGRNGYKMYSRQRQPCVQWAQITKNEKNEKMEQQVSFKSPRNSQWLEDSQYDQELDFKHCRPNKPIYALGVTQRLWPYRKRPANKERITYSHLT